MAAPTAGRVPEPVTVLVAEDEAPIRRLVVAALKFEGYHVLEAEDGRQALTVAEHHPGPIALLVCDVWMPQLSGVELARALLAQRPGLKVLFVSGYPAAAGFEQLLAPRAVHYLPKPFVPASLVREVKELLGAATGQ